jgi:photosystem II stability/assembly factor-like uncharacterized protein
VLHARVGIALLTALASGCTFYTACPDQGPAKPGNTGGSSGNTGGSGDGGDSTSAGASGNETLSPWVNVTSNLAGLSAACGNLSLVQAKGERVLAGVAAVGLWSTDDRGDTWTQIGQGEGSEEIDATPSALTFDPEHPETFWMSGIYGGHGVWRTDDDGETFRILGNVRHNDVVSVDFTDPDRQFLIVGGHESTQKMWRSTDGGTTWEDIGANIPSDARVSSYPHVLNSSTVLLGAAGYGPGKAGIFRSTDSGDSWTRVSSSGGLGRPLIASTGTFYWAGEDGSVVKSEDEGETWEEVLEMGSVSGITSLLELPDGRFATLTRANGIEIWADEFEAVTQVTERTPFSPPGFTYSDAAKAFFIWHMDCGTKVLDDAIMRADFDYEAE